MELMQSIEMGVSMTKATSTNSKKYSDKADHTVHQKDHLGCKCRLYVGPVSAVFIGDFWPSLAAKATFECTDGFLGSPVCQP